MATKVSVIIATFRPNLDFLEMQIDSILNQTRAVDEVILRDDASGLAYAEYLLTKVAVKDPRISVHIGEKNIGYAANFTEAVRLTRGDYIFFSDQDDIWYRNKVEKVLATFASHKALLVFHDQDRAFTDLSPKRITTSQLYAQNGVSELFIHGCATAVSKQIVPLLLCKPVDFAHDEWMHDLAKKLERRFFLSEALMTYRIHNDSTSRKRPLDNIVKHRFHDRLKFRSLKFKKRLDVINVLSTALVEDSTLSCDRFSAQEVIDKLSLEKLITERSIRVLRCSTCQLPFAVIAALRAMSINMREYQELLKDVISRVFRNW